MRLTHAINVVKKTNRASGYIRCPALNTKSTQFDSMPSELDTKTHFGSQSLVGKKYGRLTVVEYAGRKKSASGGRQYYWRCNCSCGNTTVVQGSDLKSRNTISCTCLRNENTARLKLRHGCARVGQKHPIYSCWEGMWARCTRPKNPSYPWYGAKGISVCERWREFENFFEDMSPEWKRGLEIDRISSKGNYEPGNCKWSTRKEQMRNVADNVWYELDGVRKVATDWCVDIGGNHRIITQRLRLGWTLRKSLTTPARIQRNSHVLYRA